MRRQLQVQVPVVQMFSEAQQELVLPADVCGEDEGTQLLFYVLPAGERGAALSKPDTPTELVCFD